MDRMPLSGCRMRPFLFHVISFYLVVDYDDLGEWRCAFLTIFKIFQTDSDCLSYRKLRNTHFWNSLLDLLAVVLFDARLRNVKKIRIGCWCFFFLPRLNREKDKPRRLHCSG